MKSKALDPAIAHHPSTSVEFGQIMMALAERKRVLQAEGAAAYAAMRAGAPPSRPMSDHERRVLGHVQHLMNGSTPSHLLMPAVSRDDQIRAEIDAIDFVERDLGRQAEIVRAREAEQWVIDHAAPWRALCREIVLAGVRLAALEDRARAMLEPIWSTPTGGLVMGKSIGSGSSLLGVGDPLLDLRNQALQENVVTASEIRKAQHVE